MKSLALVLSILIFSIISYGQNDKDLIHFNNSKVIKCTITKQTDDSLFYTQNNSLSERISLDSVYNYYYDFSKYRASAYLRRATQQTNRALLLSAVGMAAIIIVPTVGVTATPILVVGLVSISVASLVLQIDAWQQFKKAGYLLEVIEDSMGKDMDLYGK